MLFRSESYVKRMKLPAAVVQDFLSFYQKKKGTVSLNAASSQELKLWLKALIGRNLYQEEGFYPIVNTSDKVIVRALEELQ